MHEIVNRPYDVRMFNDFDLVAEIEPARVDILTSNFLETNLFKGEVLPSELTQIIINKYNQEKVEGTEIFLLLKQNNVLGRRVPTLPVFTDDILLGNINRDGFYRSLLSDGMDKKRVRKRVKEILRLFKAGVIEVEDVCLGNRTKLR